MHAMPPMPLLKRVQPSVWVALAWAAGAVFTFLIRFRLPGEEVPGVVAGVVFFRWDGLIMLAVATCMAVAGARRVSGRPLWSMILLLGASVLGTTPLSVGEIPLAQFLAVDVALFFIASAQPRRTGLVALAMALGTLVGYLSVRVLSGWNVGTSAEMAVAMTAVIAWLIGNSTHQAREYAERSRAQAAAQAVTAERLRIAREMHDTVAHSMGIIALQAGAAARVIETQPVAAREALSSIEAAGRETLAGLRRMLGALRQAEPEGAGAAEHPAAAEPPPADGLPATAEHTRGSAYAAPLDPALGLADVDRLAETTTAAGVRVEVRWLGEPRPLPAEIDISAYRIVQEAVTNVVRHAGAPSCRVTVDRRTDALSIEITDDGHGCRRGGMGAGWGLVGMRERATLLDGDFSAGPRPEGGFRVTATLPVPASPLPKSPRPAGVL
ncbi:two-component sensor histidine kinase [Streptomyces camponoticapitis]|uniref:histidine kinase n=1 Tax=Streptomyces camponoticapitis TaxID=1616125 RepID=A0ABQ2DWR7_9ACTN|nr:sensor histidine kinase [Streptomyces camponoticapitis]GGJ76342.1 two-component sensor histidine kinase [Streptomyces camponoticapitis]